MTTTGSTTYCYDKNGSMTRRDPSGTPQDNFQYDAGNRLTGFNGAVATFAYDGDGNRVMGTVSGVSVSYIGNYFEWSNSTYTKYYYAGSLRIATNRGGTLSWLLADHLGSTTVTANGTTGALAAELRFKGWGESRYASGTLATNSPAPGSTRT